MKIKRSMRLFAAAGMLVSLAVGLASSNVSSATPQLMTEDVSAHRVPNGFSGFAAGALTDEQNAVTPRSIACIGDGSTGARVHVVYAYKQGQPNRLTSLMGDFTNMAKRVNGVFYQSTVGGAPNQKVRFFTNPDCSLKVVTVKLTGTLTGADTDFAEIVNQVKAAGYTNPNRKYLIEVDLAPATNPLCGRGQVFLDDTLSSTNNNNDGYAMYAAVGSACFNSAEAHELTHMLGAVQLSAPHSSGGLHCNDDHDVMCYADGGSSSNLQVVCPIENNWFLDCNNDDYYNNNQGYPVVRPVPGYEAPYLTNHWNVALSRYLTNPADYPIWAQ